MTTRSKRWCWTMNNWDEGQKELLLTLLTDGSITYVVWGEEIAPTTGTPHLQGYLETSQKKTMKSFQTKLQKMGIHLSLLVAKGTAEQNKMYCLKSGGPSYEEGAPMKQGERSDLSLIVTMIREGKKLREIWEAHPETMIVHRRGVAEALEALQTSFVEPPPYCLDDFKKELIDTLNPLILKPPKPFVLWGESGCGKTTLARCLLPKALIVSHIDDLASYSDNHCGIIFDDMSFKHIPREAQIHLLDTDLPRSIHVRYKTALIPANTPKIFTTNEECGLIFSMPDEAIARRVSFIKFI